MMAPLLKLQRAGLALDIGEAHEVGRGLDRHLEVGGDGALGDDALSVVELRVAFGGGASGHGAEAGYLGGALLGKAGGGILRQGVDDAPDAVGCHLGGLPHGGVEGGLLAVDAEVAQTARDRRGPL